AGGPGGGVSGRASRRAAAPLCLALLALLPSACGRKGPPVPPRPAVPAAVALRAESEGRTVLLRWARPTRNADGSPLSDLNHFVLLRGADPLPGGPARESSPLRLLDAVPAVQPENATVEGDTYRYVDGGREPLPSGVRYTYQIVAVSDRGVSGLPASAVVELRPPPAPPRALRAEVGEGFVTLSWQAPPAGEAPPASAYHVYRQEAGRSGPVRITRFPVQGTRYVDLDVQNERPYRYTVRAVGGDGSGAPESEPGAPVEAMVEDRTPPAPPLNLTAVREADAIRLRWAASPEPDLLGYRVYRRALPDGRRVLLTAHPVPEPQYLDRPPPGLVAYTVTAVDRSRRRNESVPAAEVRPGP
ncbi:MAG TPA: fibronectin type III domain-containing protein, partial [Candidatus Methylomirabilis sp.]|nr:fibronectin type III domain-containing protein [Candidatus Methylomirabilis sp.]